MSNTELTDLMNTGRALEVKRAIAVRMAMSGWLRRDIADALDVSIQFIDKWKREYFENGIDALLLGYTGSEGYLSTVQRQTVISWINKRDTVTVEDLCDHIRETYDVEYRTRKSYTDLLHEAGFSRKKTGKENPKRDEAMIEAKKKKFRCSARSTGRILKRVV